MFNRMKIYTVHIKSGAVSPYEKPVFVREGFNVFAFLFTLLWAFYHRLWLPVLLILAVNATLMMLAKNHVMSFDSASIMQMGFNVFVGFQANDWLRSGLARRGYIVADIAAADSKLRAEQRYFERYLAGA